MMGELSAAQVRSARCWAADSRCRAMLLTHSLAVHWQAEAEASQTAGTEELARVSGGMLAWSCADDL